jgi:hypothetical protein
MGERQTGLIEREERPEPIRQTTITLSYFEYEIPVLYVHDEAAYIPVIELCKMLGLRAETHIPRWRRLFLWEHARKLPYQTPTRGKRMVWCLHGGALLHWFGCFHWSLVLPERRTQLEQATNEGMNVLNHMYWNMQERYKTFRCELFQFLTAYSTIETTLPLFSASLHVYLNDFDTCIQWEDIMSQGRSIIDTALKHARGQLQDQATIPILDAMRINTNGDVIEEFSLPLLPVVQEEDITQFFENIRKVAQWHQQMTQFLATHGIRWDEERKQWHLA